jgi:hypothetical protein
VETAGPRSPEATGRLHGAVSPAVALQDDEQVAEVERLTGGRLPPCDRVEHDGVPVVRLSLQMVH